jgi:hypothetical protein
MFEDDEDNGHKTFIQTPPSPEVVAYLAKWNRPAWVPIYTTPPAQPAPDNQRAHGMALRQWESWKQYALELQEKLVKYEGGAPMVLNTAPPAAQPAPVQEPSIRFNTQEALDKAKADRGKPVTPVEYKFAISDAGADSNMLWPDTMYGLLPKGTGKVTLVQRQWVGLTDDERIQSWFDTKMSAYEYICDIEAKLKERNT